MASALTNGGSTTRWRKIRAMILTRDGGVCQICGNYGADSVDHIVARQYGGDDHPDNLRAAHMKCQLPLRYAPPKPVHTTSRDWFNPDPSIDENGYRRPAMNPSD